MDELNKDLFCKLGSLSADGYFIFEQKQKCFSYLNQSMGEIWELELNTIFKNPALLLKSIHPEDADHVVSCYEESLENKAEKKYEFRLLFNEREKYVRASVFTLNHGQNEYLLGTIEDTTVMRHNKIHIEQINSRKNITLEVLAHDLKEPLGMIRLAASSIEESVASTGDAKTIDTLQFIKDMCARNLLLVRSMINREFLKSSIVEIGKERADLVWELRDVVRFYKRSKLGKTKHIQFTSPSDHIYLRLDTMKFLQVINNLISNALKFTADDGHIGLHAEE